MGKIHFSYIFLFLILIQSSLFAGCLHEYDNDGDELLAVIDVSSSQFEVEDEIILDGSNSSSKNGNIILYSWTIYDDNNVSIKQSSNRIFTTIFNTSGTYRVSLTIMNFKGLQNTTFIILHVNEPSYEEIYFYWWHGYNSVRIIDSIVKNISNEFYYLRVNNGYMGYDKEKNLSNSNIMIKKNRMPFYKEDEFVNIDDRLSLSWYHYPDAGGFYDVFLYDKNGLKYGSDITSIKLIHIGDHKVEISYWYETYIPPEYRNDSYIFKLYYVWPSEKYWYPKYGNHLEYFSEEDIRNNQLEAISFVGDPGFYNEVYFNISFAGKEYCLKSPHQLIVLLNGSQYVFNISARISTPLELDYWGFSSSDYTDVDFWRFDQY